MNDWQTSKTLKDISEAYSEIYEAKKKVDQDGDGDTDFADVQIARMIASGMSREQAIAMTKNKSYNKKEIEYVDEGIRSTIKGLFSKKKEEAPKPESRGDQLRRRYNVGPEGSDTSVKRRILARSQAHKDAAKRQVNIGNASQSYADAASDAHDRYLKAGYSKYGADRPFPGKGKKARNRAAAMTANEAYEFVASYLLENNFAETLNDANVIINNMSESWFNQIMEG